MGKYDLNNSTDVLPDAIPLTYFNAYTITCFIWSKPEIHLEVLETKPYSPDGSHPLVYFQLGFVEILLYNHTMYNYLYKRKFGYLPEVLK